MSKCLKNRKECYKKRNELNFTKSTGKMNRETETYIFLVSNNDRKKDSRKTPFISLISTLKKM